MPLNRLVTLCLLLLASVANGAENPLDPVRAMSYLQAVCDIGPRMSGSKGMKKQRELLSQHFQALSRKVEQQSFNARHPLSKRREKRRVPMTNLIVRWRPELTDRILLCCHYDTRPLPDQDPNPRARKQGVFIGANDGGSGVAVLMELAHHLNAIDDQLQVGVDLVFFDGEELVYNDSDPYFLGSTWFAMQYKELQKRPAPPYRYLAGVLLDMVGDTQLKLYIEEHSWFWRDTRPVVQSIWAKADELGVKEFIPRYKREILDDHIPLRNIGKIPTCDIIDPEYPDAFFGQPGSYWHTESDLPKHCSGESLAKVGWVVFEWIKDQSPTTLKPKP